MLRDRIPARQLSAWIFAAITPVSIQLLCGGSWVWIGIAGATAGLMTLLVWQKGWRPSKWQCPILFIYIVVLISQLLSKASQSWPVGNSYPAVPLILLFLAAWSAQKGLSAAARVGAVLFWVVLIVYLVMLGAGIKDVNLPWLKPKWDTPDPLGLTVLLLPAGASLLGSGGKCTTKLFMPMVFTIAAAIITAGVLSPAVAEVTPSAFYEMSRSINLLGVARRFEALISAGMSVGWFALMSLLLSMCGVLAQIFLKRRQRSGVWTGACAAVLGMLCGLHISGYFLLLAGAVFWVLLPLLTQGLGLEKKS